MPTRKMSLFPRVSSHFSETKISRDRLVGFGFGAMVFIWPFLFFREFLFSTSPYAINNDFNVLYYAYKVYLLDSVAGGHFPLWSPGEGSGFPFYSNPFTQAFYPLNLLLVFIYKVLGGYSYFDHQRYSVFGAALFGLGLYFWLKEILPSRRGAFFAALVFSISFKVGELLRFPNAIHAAAWIPWILYGVAKARESRASILSAFIIFVACFSLLTAGYPYYCYYCLFLIPPYALLLLSAKARLALHGKSETAAAPPVSHRRYLLTCLIPAASALLLCTPYYLKMQQLFQNTAARKGSNYDFATVHEFSGSDTLGALIFPPSAQSEGWYFFGFAGLSILLLYFVGVFSDSRPSGRDRLFAVIILSWFAIITYITYGKNSYLFDFLFHWLPGFDRLRVWGRLNIVLLPILALGLGRAYLYLEGILSDDSEDNRKRRARSIKISLAVAMVIGLLQTWLYSNEIYDRYWAVLLAYLQGAEWQFIALNLTMGILLCGLMIFTSRRPLKSKRSRLALVLFLSTFAFAELTLYGGARLWIKINNVDPTRERHDISAYLRGSLEVPRIRRYFTLKYPHSNVGIVSSWYFTNYVALYLRVFDLYGNVVDAAKIPHFNRLMGISEAKRLFVSARIDHSSMSAFLLDSERMEASLGSQIEIISYDGERLEFTLELSGAAYVSFIDNWDPDWKAYLNNKEVPIEKLFGTFKSISLPSGISHVRFSYEPFSF